MTSMASQVKPIISEEEFAKINVPCGWSLQELHEKPRMCKGYTFDDLIMLPGRINFSVHDVNLSTKLTRNISLKLPFVSSPMDTVTEHRMARDMALLGGIGIIHHSNTIEEQCRLVAKVKNFKNGFITKPDCMAKTATIADAEQRTKERGYSGFLITENGLQGEKLLGIVSSRDTDFHDDKDSTLEKVMVPVSELVTIEDGCTLDDANDLLQKHKLGKLPVLSKDGKVVSLISRTDLTKNRDFPNATKDPVTKRLLCGAAVAEGDYARVDALVEAGADVLVIDSKQGNSTAQVETIKYIKKKYPTIEVIGGNAVTSSQVENLISAGVDALRVGMGSGAVSTAQVLKAVGRAQASAIYYTSRIAAKHGIPVIADGAVANTGCAIKALSAGASCVMMGSLLAGTEESPGQYFFQDGMRLKKFRGTAAQNAFRTGVSGAVVDKGTIRRFIPYMAQSVKHGFQDLGETSIMNLHEGISSGRVRFELRSGAAQKEGGVHDLYTYEKRLFN